MSEERKKINYTVALVSEFAKAFGLSQKQAFEFLYHYQAIAFIKENYDIEHTLSFADAVNDCKIICERNGGVLA